MRSVQIVILALFMGLAFAGTGLSSEQSDKITLDVKSFTLDNGMMFLVKERPELPQVAARLAIRAGSALEESGKTGIAHLLEHIMFKGTKNFGTLDVNKDRELQGRIEVAYQAILKEEAKRRPDRDLIKSKREEMARLRLKVQEIFISQVFSKQLGKNGATSINAFTSRDQTQYMASVPADMLEQWFSIISEQLFEPSWREFYVEKEVVQREWAYRYVNDPNGAAWLDLYSGAFKAHPYKNPTIGWKSDMEKFSTQDAVAFHKKFYNPTNSVCVLVGDVKFEEVKRLAETYFARYPAGELSPEYVTREPVQNGPRRSVRYLKGARTPLLMIGFHAPKMGTKDFYALDALTMILSQGQGAKLKQNVVNKGLAVSAWSGQPDNRYGGLFILAGSPHEPDELKKGDKTDEEKQALFLEVCRDLEDILLQEVGRYKTELTPMWELDRIRKLNQKDFVEGMRSNSSLAGTLATMEVQVGWQYLNTYIDNLKKITPEDISDAVNKYFDRDNMTVVYVVPGGIPDRVPEQYTEERSMSGAAASDFEKPDSFENRSIYPTPNGWKHPLSFNRKPKKINYPKAETSEINGTKVFYLPDNELPLIDLTIMVKAGSVDTPDNKMGLTGILNGVLIRGGTENYSPLDLAKALDESAIEISFSSGEEDTTIHMLVMKEDWERGLKLLEEIINRPRFDNNILNAVKARALASIQRQGGDAQGVSKRERKTWHFKGHPYGRDPLLSLETIPGLTKKDLRDFLTTYIVPANMVVAVSGDISREKAVAGLKGFLGSLPEGEINKRNLPDPEENSPVLALIHKPGQVQSWVALGQSGVKRAHPQYWKLNLLMNILGGGDSLVYRRLRDDLGLVYATWFYETYKWKAGMLWGQIGCKADKTGEAIKETVKIMKSLGKEVPERELEQKRLDSLNSFVFNVDRPEDLVETYAKYYMRNEPLDTLERIQDAFIGAEQDELRALAEKYLDPKKLQIFIVADKNIKLRNGEGQAITLEEDLKALAKELDLPYRELPLR